MNAFLTLVLWTASAAISFAGAWFIKFTQEDAAKPGRLRLTRAGWWTLPLASGLFLLGFGLQIRDQRHASATATENHELAQRVIQMQSENHALAQTVTEVSGNVRQLGIGLQQILSRSKDAQSVLAQDPKVASDVRAAFDSAARTDPSMQQIKEQLERFLSGNLIQTPLEKDIEAKDSAGVARALELGADPNVSGDEGVPPLARAALNDDIPNAKALLARGADVNRPSLFVKQTPLFKAHSVAMAELLLAHGADINAVDDSGETPLSFAAIPPNETMVKYYIGRHANPNVANKLGETVLGRLATHGKLETVQLLLEAGADPNFGPNPARRAALNEVMQSYHCPPDDRIPILSALIEHGARCDLKDQYGTPLERATARHCPAFVSLLQRCATRPAKR